MRSNNGEEHGRQLHRGNTSRPRTSSPCHEQELCVNECESKFPSSGESWQSSAIECSGAQGYSTQNQRRTPTRSRVETRRERQEKKEARGQKEMKRAERSKTRNTHPFVFVQIPRPDGFDLGERIALVWKRCWQVRHDGAASIK